ncbi:N(,)N'-diacetyllegionaminate synthase [Parelusimicrobium proximum]|uniref:N-acetylneuraminate synthase n=1 Tax=Parelusimicrobium proximum TaxID=3228953 RepID=UPI003D16C604
MKRVYIIAEAGVNHNGDIKNAFKLIDAAKEAGADAVKFQTFKAEKLVSASADKAEYQKKNTNSDGGQLEMLKKLELSYGDFKELKKYCDAKGIEFLSTPFDEESGDFLISIGMDKIKISSGDMTNKFYLEWAASKNLPVILSTGMSDMSEVREAAAVLTKTLAKDKITLLHCSTEYPAPYGDVNLRAMESMRRELGVSVGYSDHTEGIEVSVAAAALGAEVIEKHFTLDKTMDGPDHKASLEPHELKALVSAVRHIEAALGNGVKEPSPSEIKNIKIARKSIHTIRDLKKGDVIARKDITAKRPADGVSPMKADDVIGKTLAKDLPADTAVKAEDII